MHTSRRSKFGAVLLALFMTLATMSMMHPVADAAPGDVATLTDASGNEFSYQLSVTYDGTGHGTNGQCFINSANGYAVGDNTPDDGVVCTSDTAEYRIDWNATIKDPASAKVTFNLSNSVSGDPDAYGALGAFDWSKGGITGGSELGFVGSGRDTQASMQFNKSGTMSGVLSFTFTPSTEVEIDDLRNALRLHLAIDGKMGDSEASSEANRELTVVNSTRYDSQLTVKSSQVLTTVGDKAYRRIEMITGTTKGSDGGSSNRFSFPSHPGTKGITGHPTWATISDRAITTYDKQKNIIDHENSSPLRHTYYDAMPGALGIVDGQPVQVQWDGTDAWFEAPAGAKAEFLVPWDELTIGNHELIVRSETTGHFVDYAGAPVTNGELDPGVGLSCDVSTSGVLPGSPGGNTMPNNNCAKVLIIKRDFDGAFDKTIRFVSYASVDDKRFDVTLPNGEVVERTRLPGDAFESRFQISPPPLGSGREAAVCDVWEPSETKIAGSDPRKSLTVNGVPVQEAFPGVKVMFTTQDLLPDGAPVVEAAPLCGDPRDTSVWSETAPSDTSLISGVMVLFPGTDTMTSAITLSLKQEVQHYSNFEEFVTLNVRNYAGYAWDTTTGEPEYAYDSDHLNVIRSSFKPSLNINNGNTQSLPIGQSVVKTNYIQWFEGRSGAPAPNSTQITRVYLDHCAIDPQTAMKAGQYPWLLDVQFVEGNQTFAPEDCGTLSDAYFEFTISLDERSSATYLGGAQFSFTTPTSSMPGDTFVMQSQTSLGDVADGEEFLFHPSTGNMVTWTVADSAVIGSSKTTSHDLVPKNAEFTDTIGWFNFLPNTAGRVQLIDVLPHNGDGLGTKFSGTNPLKSVTYSGRPEHDGLTTYEFTKQNPADIDRNPSAASNTDGTTVWCSGLSGGDCPADMGEVTALRFTTSELGSGVSQFFDLTFAPEGNQHDDIYVNRLSEGSASKLNLPIPAPEPVQTKVWQGLISGTSWYDTSKDAVIDADEPGRFCGEAITLLNADGEEVTTTVTAGDADSDGVCDNPDADDNGFYEFEVGAGDWTVISGEIDEHDRTTVDQYTVTVTPEDRLHPDNNFGYVGNLGSLAGTVWLDDDGNGNREDTETTRYPDFTAELKDSDGATVQTTITDADGRYLFEKVKPGEYTVQFTPAADAADLEPTIRTEGCVEATSCTDPTSLRTDTVTVVANEVRDHVDFGLVFPTVEFKFTKVAPDAVAAEMCPGGLEDGMCLIEGAEFALYDQNPSEQPDAAPVEVTRDGGWWVADVEKGTYWIVETKAPVGYELLAQPVEIVVSDDGVASADNSASVLVSPADAFTVGLVDVTSGTLPKVGGAGVSSTAAMAVLVFAALAAVGVRVRRVICR